jgi:hypothetical protein
MRVFGTIATYLVALAVTAAVTLFAVLFLAGPHGGALPSSLHSATLVVGWLVVIIVPILAGRWAWRRFAPSRD